MKSIILVFLMIYVSVLSAQKTKKIKYDGYFKNIARYDLNLSGYQTFLSLDEYAEGVAKAANLTLQVKGVPEGDGIKVVLELYDPVIVTEVKKDVKKVNGVDVTNYTGIVRATIDSKMTIINEDGLPILEYSLKKDDLLFPTKTRILSDRRAVDAELLKVKKEKGGEVKRKSVIATFATYQKKLDDCFGKFNCAEKLRVFQIVAKKFDYKDFNDAVVAFQDATSSDDVDSDEKRIVIQNAINVWEQYAKAYEPGKKAKVCDVNIDEIYYNLTIGYLAMGDGANMPDSWEKCLSYKGNATAEGYAYRYVPDMIGNYDFYMQNKDKPLKPFDVLTDKQRFNDMYFFDGIFGYYLTQKFKDSYASLHYFPAQYQFLKSASVTKQSGKTSFEDLQYEYTAYGMIKRLVYVIRQGNEVARKRVFTFEYNEYGVSKVYLDNNLLVFTVQYDMGYVDEVKWHLSNTKKMVLKTQSNESNRIGVKIDYYQDGKVLPSKKEYYYDYDEKFNIIDFKMPGLNAKEQRYDEFGNAVYWGYYNQNYNKVVGLDLEVKVDDKGNALSVTGDEYLVTGEYEYLY